jgi:4-amino-4-deoxy-L-arabinose transferase-like glycosyltransferase
MTRSLPQSPHPMPLCALDRLSAVFAGLVDGLCDPRRRRRVAAGLVCAYTAAWTLYGVIAKSSQDLNADMAEMVVWAREPALGYPKHPPLLAFVVKLWFSIFPLADWAFTLLATITVAAGIYLAIELNGIWLEREKRAAVPFLLGLIPFYNVLALKFDQNSALIPLWALAMWGLIRSLESRRTGWAMVTGLAAAAAMLTKYWSAFLLAAMAFTTLADRRRNAYWRSPAPWLTALVFVLAVLPHAIWLIAEKFPPLTWIGTRRTTDSAWDLLDSLAEYSFGTIGYSALAIIAAALLLRPPIAAVRDSWFATEPTRRPATILFWAPLLLPIAVALGAGTDLLSLWNAPSLNLLPAMMLASPLILVSRCAVLRLAAIATAITLAAVVLSPLVALAKLKHGVENNAQYGRLAAAAAESAWRETTSAPLRLVAGPFALASSASFYMTDRPSTYANFSQDLSPWVSESRIARDGVVIICPARDTECLRNLNTLAGAGPPGRSAEVTLRRHWFGFTGAAERFVIATVPPRP